MLHSFLGNLNDDDDDDSGPEPDYSHFARRSDFQKRRATYDDFIEITIHIQLSPII